MTDSLIAELERATEGSVTLDVIIHGRVTDDLKVPIPLEMALRPGRRDMHGRARVGHECGGEAVDGEGAGMTREEWAEFERIKYSDNVQLAMVARCEEQGHEWENCCSVTLQVYQACKWCSTVR